MKTKNLLLFSIAVLALFVNSQRLQASTSYSWSSLPFGGGGFVSGIITSDQEKNLIYARTDVGGAYRWIESSKSWKPLNDNLSDSDCGLMGIESLAIDPTKPSRVYIYCGTSYFSGGKSAILCSDNYGDTWTTKAVVTSSFPANGNSSGRQSGERLAVDPNNGNVLLCGSRTRGLWRSVNSGTSWTRVDSLHFPNDQKVAFVQYVASSGKSGATTPVVYAGILKNSATNLYVSSDGGVTWTAVGGQRTDYMPHRCTLAGQLLYVTYTDSEGPGTGGSGAIMKYDMSAKTWTDISPAGYSFGEVSVAKGNSDYLVTSSLSKWLAQNWVAGAATSWGDQIFVSTNGGKSWTNLMTTKKATYSESLVEWQKSWAKLHWCGSVKIDPFDTNRAFFTSGNGLFATDNLWDAAPAFHMAETGLEETVPSDIVSVAGSPLAVTIADYDGCLYSDVTKYSKRFTKTMGYNANIAIAPKNVNDMIRVGGSIYYSQDGGTSWNKLSTPDTSATSYNSCAIGSSAKVLVVTPKNCKPYYSLDNGTTWKVFSDAIANVMLFGDGATEGVFYAVYSSAFHVFKVNTSTGAVIHTSTSLTGANNARGLCVVPGVSGDVWISRGNYGITHLTNAHNGASTITATNITISRATCIGVGKSATATGYPALYIWGRPKSTDAIGLYLSNDKGTSWTRINDDQHQFGGPGNAQKVTGDMNYYGRVYMSTVGRGVICGMPTTQSPDTTATVTYAGLRHTAGTQWGSNTGANTVNAEKEHYNKDQGSAWAGAAFAEFNFDNLPAGEMITKATLVYSTYQNGKIARDEKIYSLNPGVTLDYNAILSKANYQYKDDKTLAAAVNTGGAGLRQDLKADVTNAVKAMAAKGQTNIIMQWTDNAASADLYGMTSNLSPALLITTFPSTTYTVKFVDASGNELKTAVVHNDTLVGTTIAATAAEKSSFYNADKTKKYIYKSGDAAITLVKTAASNVITLVFREAATYSYKVNSNVGTYSVSAFSFEGDYVRVPYPEYQLVGSTLYHRDATNLEYNYYFTLSSNNMTKTLDYADTGISNVVYYAEAENISGLTATTAGNAYVRCSNSEGGYNAGSTSVTATTLPAGTYQMTAVVWGNAGTNLLIDYGCGTNWTITTRGYRYAESKSFTLTQSTAIKIPQCGNSKKSIDLIYIQNNSSQSSAKPSVISCVDNVEADSPDSPIYNMQGVIVKNPTHGVYIKNGKKFMVK